MGTQGSGYLVFSCQLSGLCPDYGVTSVIFCVGLWSQLLEPVACPSLAPRVLDHDTGHARYPFKTHTLH